MKGQRRAVNWKVVRYGFLESKTVELHHEGWINVTWGVK